MSTVSTVHAKEFPAVVLANHSAGELSGGRQSGKRFGSWEVYRWSLHVYDSKTEFRQLQVVDEQESLEC